MSASTVSIASEASFGASAQALTYELYGIGIRTPWPLINVPYAANRPWKVEFVEGDAKTFAAAAAHIPEHRKGQWYQSATLPDGSVLCRWLGLFDFIVPTDARRIEVRCYRHASEEGLQAYLLNQALSFSMVQLGREPLHATAVLTDHGVIGFMGESRFGKSTLGALLVEAGCPLVTDDMFVLGRTPNGFIAYPGPPRIKLYRHVADRVFGSRYSGIPMNPTTKKLIIPMTGAQAVSEPKPLHALYVIEEPAHARGRGTQIDRLSAGQAFPAIIAASLNNWIVDSERLQRQFQFATDLVRTVPVKVLAYPRDKEQMFALRDAVLADASQTA
ncbi:MAG: hypothetical protein ACLQDV_08445 [Candidatus Binataceae bacterium]